MSRNKCHVQDCWWDSGTSKLSYFSLPSDPNTRAVWNALVIWKSKPKLPNVCELHFTSKDFRDARGLRKRLKKNAFPTIFKAPLTPAVGGENVEDVAAGDLNVAAVEGTLVTKEAVHAEVDAGLAFGLAAVLCLDVVNQKNVTACQSVDTVVDENGVDVDTLLEQGALETSRLLRNVVDDCAVVGEGVGKLPETAVGDDVGELIPFARFLQLSKTANAVLDLGIEEGDSVKDSDEIVEEEVERQMDENLVSEDFAYRRFGKASRNLKENGEIYGLDFLKGCYKVWQACECCTEWCMKDRMSQNSKGNHECVEPDGWLCRRCSKFEPSGKEEFCRFSHAENFLDPGEQPSFMKGIGYMELQVIRLIQPFMSIYFVPASKTLPKVKGQLCQVVCEVEKSLLNMMPDPQHGNILSVRQKKPSTKASEGVEVPRFSQRYAVDLEVVYEALEWLKENNPLYRDIELMSREQYEELVPPDPDVVLEKIDVVESVALLDMLGSTKVDQDYFGEPRTLEQGEGGFVWDSGPQGDRDRFPPDEVDLEYDQKDSREEKSYPNLFPDGCNGARESNRPYSLKSREYYRHRLSSHDNRFSRDISYTFRAQNLVQREAIMGGIKWAAMQGDKKMNKNLKVSDIAEDVYPLAGGRIRGSEVYYRKGKRDLRNMINCLGAPLIYGTVNLNYMPEFLCAVEPEIFGTIDAPDWVAVDSIKHEKWLQLVDENCGLAAKMWDVRVREFIKFLQNPKDPAFPDGEFAREVFAKIEFQRSGFGHVHYFCWLSRQFNVKTQEGREAAVKFLDELVTTEPATGSGENWPKLMSLQTHIHTFTCQKGAGQRFRRLKKKTKDEEVAETVADELRGRPELVDEETGEILMTEEQWGEFAAEFLADFVGERKGRLNWLERMMCRFGFRQDLATETHFRTTEENKGRVKGDRDYLLRRLSEASRRIVAYRRQWMPLFRCNMDLQLVTDVYAALIYIFHYISKPEQRDKTVLDEIIAAADDDVKLFTLLLRMTNAVLSHRQIGKFESAMITLGIPLYHCSVSSINLDTRPPNSRQRVLKKRFDKNTQLKKELYYANFLDHYQGRLYAVEKENNEAAFEILETMTYYEFGQWFVVEKTGRLIDQTDFEAEVGENVDEFDFSSPHDIFDPGRNKLVPNPFWRENLRRPPFLAVPDTHGRQPRVFCDSGALLRQRKKGKNATFGLGYGVENEKVYAMLMVTIPFGRKESFDLLGDEGSLYDANALKNRVISLRTQIEESANRFPNLYKAIVTDCLASFVDGVVGTNRKKVQNSLRSDWNTENGLDKIPSEFLSGDDEVETTENPLLNTSTFGEEVFYTDIDTSDFTAKQLEVFNIVKSYLAEYQLWRIGRFDKNSEAVKPCMPKPFHLMVQGSPGTGKTWVIEKIVQLIQNFTFTERAGGFMVPRFKGGVLKCAYTGCAAKNIEGTTLHQLFSLGRNGRQALSGVKLDNLAKKMENMFLLIVDEVSMMPRETLYEINQRMNLVCGKTKSPDAVFGEKCVLFLGDFHQLQPVGAKFIFQTEGLRHPISLWHSLFRPIIFTQNKRQENDLVFGRLLNELRSAQNLSDEMDEMLISRCLDPEVNPEWQSVLAEYEAGFEDAVHLYSMNAPGDTFNANRLAKVSHNTGNAILQVNSKDSHDFQRLKVDDLPEFLSTCGRKLAVQEQKTLTGGLASQVSFCVGARVMITQNIDVEAGIVNGAFGVVESVFWRHADTQILSKDSVDEFTLSSELNFTYARHKGKVQQMHDIRAIVVEMPGAVDVKLDGQSRAVRILPYRGSFNDKNGRPVARIQLPFMLAYAITIHKSQGATIPKGAINLRFSSFKPAAGFYVALSRFRTRRDFILLDYSRDSFRYLEHARDEVKRLEALEDNWEERPVYKLSPVQKYAMKSPQKRTVTASFDGQMSPKKQAVGSAADVGNNQDLSSACSNTAIEQADLVDINTMGRSINCEVVDLLCKLMHDNFADKFYGLLPVSLLANGFGNGSFLVKSFRDRPRDHRPVVQIFFVGGNHFVAVEWDETLRKLYLYDSLPSECLRDDLKMQIWALFGNDGEERIEVVETIVQEQKAEGNSCAAFALAFVFCRIIGRTVKRIIGSDLRLRRWVLACITDGKIAKFPLAYTQETVGCAFTRTEEKRTILLSSEVRSLMEKAGLSSCVSQSDAQMEVDVFL